MAAQDIADFLERAGLGRPRSMEALSGGVSSDIWRAEVAGRTVCVKRALPRLRVAELWEAPIERNRYEREWLELAREAAASSAPQVLAWDDAEGLFAMECLDYPVWKALLLQGKADAAFAAAVGSALGAIHAATAKRADLACRFATDAIFYAIRLEPYLAATARKHADLASLLDGLLDRTASTRLCLVHGDVSPKNILVSPAGPIFLDAECAWYGDPAFDIAFCLNHMFLKCARAPSATRGFLQCFDALSAAYLARVTWEPASAVEERAATLLPGLLLARIDGKSPVEYLDADAQARVRAAARGLLAARHATLGALRSAWHESST